MPLREGCCYVIAEFGSNHYGNREHALRAIETAKDAGADACKFQLFRLEDILRNVGGDGRPGECGDRKTELPPEWIPQLADTCREHRIDFLCTPFSAWAVDILNPYVWAWKIGSFEWKRDDIWKAVIATRKPVIASQGRGLPEIAKHWGSYGAVDFYRLQCVSKYPVPLDEMHLWYESEWSGGPQDWGLSDHTTSTLVPALAVARGAHIIEKHFRLDDTPEQSPDYGFALTPDQLGEMVRNIRLAELTCWRQPPAEIALESYPNRREE